MGDMTSGITLTVVIAIWLVCGVIASIIGQSRGRGAGTSFLWGALLGIIGIVVVTVAPVRIRPVGDVPVGRPWMVWMIAAYGVAALATLYAVWPTNWWPWPQLAG